MEWDTFLCRTAKKSNMIRKCMLRNIWFYFSIQRDQDHSMRYRSVGRCLRTFTSHWFLKKTNNSTSFVILVELLAYLYTVKSILSASSGAMWILKSNFFSPQSPLYFKKWQRKPSYPNQFYTNHKHFSHMFPHWPTSYYESGSCRKLYISWYFHINSQEFFCLG